MARDDTTEDMIETILYIAGVGMSGDVASAITDCLRENSLLVEDKPELLTPVYGQIDDRDHMGFILRIFQHFVEQQPTKNMTVDLNVVLASTKGRQMQVMLDGPVFKARTVKSLEALEIPTKGIVN